MTDNLKLPEPFEWINSRTVAGNIEGRLAYISIDSPGVARFESLHYFYADDLALIIEAMKAAQKIYQARNQPN